MFQFFMNKLIRLLTAFGLMAAHPLTAQLPTACNGTVSGISCEVTCISCNFNGFVGSTAGYPSGVVPEFCGTVENVQWLGFIAGESNATFTINPSNCVNGDGLQVALYQYCDMPPIACEKGEMGGGLMPVAINVPLQVGSTYFLLVDGYAGDLCDFSVSVSPASAVFEPPLGVATLITGPDALCPGASAEYVVQPVSGAAAYIWTGPAGMLFDSMPSPATIIGKNNAEVIMGSAGGQICVQAANACEVNAPCAASLNITILGDDSRPQFSGDTLLSLSCVGNPIELDPGINLSSNVSLAWTTDSTGHFVSDTNLIRVMVDSIGTYTLFAEDLTNGCTAEFSVRVTNPVFPVIGSVRITDVNCFGDKNGRISIGEVSSGTPPYLYRLDDEPFSEVFGFASLPPGPHTLTVLDAAECETDTTILVQEPAQLLVNLGPDTAIVLGQMLALWDSSNINFTARIRDLRLEAPFLPADSLLYARCQVMPIETFRYQLTVVDSSGCEATATRLVSVDNKRRVYFPNVFMPDVESAAGNDRFTLGYGPDVVQVKSLVISDRWGHFVHSRFDLAPNDPNLGWDGRQGRRKSPPGVYVYKAEIEFKDGAVELFKGDVTIVR
jgi:PKD-like domain/SprB repeat